MKSKHYSIINYDTAIALSEPRALNQLINNEDIVETIKFLINNNFELDRSGTITIEIIACQQDYYLIEPFDSESEAKLFYLEKTFPNKFNLEICKKNNPNKLETFGIRKEYLDDRIKTLYEKFTLGYDLLEKEIYQELDEIYDSQESRILTMLKKRWNKLPRSED